MARREDEGRRPRVDALQVVVERRARRGGKPSGVDPEPPLAQLGRFLRIVGTFDPNSPIEKTAYNQAALGTLGYNAPSLLSIYAFPPYLHNGACLTLECVLENQAHREAGGKTGILEDPAARQALVQFLISIDAKTEPVNP